MFPASATFRRLPLIVGVALGFNALAITDADAAIFIEASSVSLAQQSQQGRSSSARIQNGVLVTNDNRSAPDGTHDAGPIGPNPTRAFANTTQIDGAILCDSAAEADLAKGNHSSLVNALGPAPEGFSASLGLSNTRWLETVTFNNTNASAVNLDVFLDTDGAVTDTGGPNIGTIDIQSSILFAIVNDANYKDVHLLGGPAFYMGGCQYIYSGVSGARFGFQPRGNNQYDTWTTTHTGATSGLIKATLVIPPGVVSITIDSSFSVDARTGAVCDYTEGVNFRFGDLPAGLTWTSESGVFLSGTTAGGLDSDNDGTPDVSDQCPTDPNKTAPGSCGCGVADVDTDSDGICDGVDNCPNAANADQADADSDGVGDACDAGNENANGGGNANENGSNANQNSAGNANANTGSSNSNKNSGDGTASDPPIGACAAPAMPLALMPLLALSRRHPRRRNAVG